MTVISSLTCPICDESCADRPDLRCHLMGRHRKSELIDLVLEREELADRIAVLPSA